MPPAPPVPSSRARCLPSALEDTRGPLSRVIEDESSSLEDQGCGEPKPRNREREGIKESPDEILNV